MASLTSLLVSLYRRLDGRDPDPAFAKQVDALRDDYSLEDDGDVPAWLTDALSAALEGRATEPALFDDLDSEVDSFLSEVSAEVPGWEHDDQGESIAIRLPALKLQIFISREALSATGGACCSWEVLPIGDGGA